MDIKEHLIKYTSYNLWANKRITEKLKEIEPALWLIEQKSSFRTIRDTLLHIYDAETLWYKRLKGESLKEWPSNGYTGTNEDAAEMWLEVSDNFIQLVKSSSEEFLISLCSFRNLEGNEYNIMVSDIIQHCMNHSTFHRGQIITMLRFCNVNGLPSTDYITY